MSYTIRLTIIDYTTGETRERTLRRRWKTWQGAENYAARYLRWICKPDGVTATEESSAEVVKLPGGGQ